MVRDTSQTMAKYFAKLYTVNVGNIMENCGKYHVTFTYVLAGKSDTESYKMTFIRKFICLNEKKEKNKDALTNEMSMFENP